MKVKVTVEELIRISRATEKAKNRTIRLILSQLESKTKPLDGDTRKIILDHINAMVRDFYRVFDSRIEP